MGYFYDTFSFAPGSRLTGLWRAPVDCAASDDVVALASLVEFGELQHDELESDFLNAHLPFRLGGFHGVGPDGNGWAVFLQVAPASAADLVGSDSVYWPMLDGLDRALHYNWEASLVSDRGFSRGDLIDIYVQRGLESWEVDDWAVPDLMLGLLAECCYVSLPQIVAGRVSQCAFPGQQHECQYDVFSDVFAAWMGGGLHPPEPAA